jgi:hypothetical protein
VNQSHRILIRNLPKNFTKTIHDHIRLYSVTMLLAESIKDDSAIPCSGTLCTFGSKAGIVTARHVWEEIQKHEVLIMMTGRNQKLIKTKNIVPTFPQPTSKLPNTNDKVPDIAFLYLDANQKAEIEGLGKVFYSINRRSNSSYIDVKNFEDGYWAIFGNPKAFLCDDKRTVTSFIYGTGVKLMDEIDGWDYLSVDLNIPENLGIPKSFAGVSGGGVWRTIWNYDSDQKLFFVSNLIEECIFYGVCFYETDEDGRRLIAHGPTSIYKSLSCII